MKIENLKPGDKVKLFKFETLVKKDLISRSTIMEVPNRRVGIEPDMLDVWNNILIIQEITKSTFSNVPVIIFTNNIYRWLPEWICHRVK